MIADLTSTDAVLKAVAEYDSLGQQAFLTKYGYGPARSYFLRYSGRLYDSKAVVGVALGYQFPARGPLRADEFSGGERTVKRKLEELGFEVVSWAPTGGNWWSDVPEEVFWLEITDRPDVGIDLHCPQRDASKRPSSGYTLINDVARGDIVFHYERERRAITAWSRAVGEVVERPTVWLSHRGQTRRRLGVAVEQPGWYLDLEGPFPLPDPLTLQGLRQRTELVRAVLESLQRDHRGEALYFPFFFYGGSTLRPMQPYLNKLPAELVARMPELATAAALARATRAVTLPPAPGGPAGTTYREASVTGLAERDPFSVDPAIIERGLRGHADTQNALAAKLNELGIEPRSPKPGEPNFDLCWEHDARLYIAEVKSTTGQNAERQLRLGLGQVLRYRHLFENAGYERVIGVLVAENQPDPSWSELCASLAVLLIWPQTMSEALAIEHVSASDD